MKHRLTRRIYWWLRDYPAQKVLDLLQESQWWPRERLNEFRNEKLRAIIRHCYDHVPYYRRVMDERSLKPDDFRTAEDLPKLPLLTKDLVRHNIKDLLSDNIPQRQTYVTRTGGTTGEPMRIRRWPPDVAWQTQCYVRGLSWGGLGLSTPRVKLFGGSLGQEPSRRISGFLRRLLEPRMAFLPAFELAQQNVDQYIKIIQATSPHIIGYASALYLLAVYALAAGRTCRIEAVYPTAELLLPEWRDQIIETFGCRVLPYYGCGEVNSLGYACGEGPGFHRCEEHAIMEVEGNDGSTSFKGEGAFIITDLDNYAMPFIRYANGDAGVLTDEPCPCGRGLGRIRRLDGRVNDLLVTCDGNRISGVIATHAFRYVSGARFYQFVQDRPGHVLVRVVATPDYRPEVEEPRIRGILKDHLGADARIEFEYPPDIERTQAGKARFVINHFLEQQSG